MNYQLPPPPPPPPPPEKPPPEKPLLPELLGVDTPPKDAQAAQFAEDLERLLFSTPALHERLYAEVLSHYRAAIQAAKAKLNGS